MILMLPSFPANIKKMDGLLEFADIVISKNAKTGTMGSKLSQAK
jgi:hypothetical protein